MRSVAILSAAIVLAFAPEASPQQLDALKSAADALGVNQIKTLEFTGSGATFSVGQNFGPNDHWPRVTLKRYTALINYETGGMRQELLREMGPTMPRGAECLSRVQCIKSRRSADNTRGIFPFLQIRRLVPCRLDHARLQRRAAPHPRPHRRQRVRLRACLCSGRRHKAL